jgi:hypothetical protein
MHIDGVLAIIGMATLAIAILLYVAFKERL